jgi:hypothetical protein
MRKGKVWNNSMTTSNGSIKLKSILKNYSWLTLSKSVNYTMPTR